MCYRRQPSCVGYRPPEMLQDECNDKKESPRSTTKYFLHKGSALHPLCQVPQIQPCTFLFSSHACSYGCRSARCVHSQVTSPSLSSDDGGVAATGLFRKRYDAFPSKNELRGTCMVGQLLDEGYQQMQDNGM